MTPTFMGTTSGWVATATVTRLASLMKALPIPGALTVAGLRGDRFGRPPERVAAQRFTDRAALGDELHQRSLGGFQVRDGIRAVCEQRRDFRRRQPVGK